MLNPEYIASTINKRFGPDSVITARGVAQEAGWLIPDDEINWSNVVADVNAGLQVLSSQGVLKTDEGLGSGVYWNESAPRDGDGPVYPVIDSECRDFQS